MPFPSRFLVTNKVATLFANGAGNLRHNNRLVCFGSGCEIVGQVVLDDVAEVDVAWMFTARVSSAADHIIGVKEILDPKVLERRWLLHFLQRGRESESDILVLGGSILAVNHIVVVLLGRMT